MPHQIEEVTTRHFADGEDQGSSTTRRTVYRPAGRSPYICVSGRRVVLNEDNPPVVISSATTVELVDLRALIAKKFSTARGEDTVPVPVQVLVLGAPEPVDPTDPA